MTEGRYRPDARFVIRALLALLLGMLAGGGLNAALGEQGADTPALALLGGALALGAVILTQAPTAHAESAERLRKLPSGSGPDGRRPICRRFPPRTGGEIPSRGRICVRRTVATA